MKEKENRENAIKIFCILSQKEHKNRNIILDHIAKLGGTDSYYSSRSLYDLCQIFENINEAIETNYGLKLNNIE